METDVSKVLKDILIEAGIQSYEPEIVTHLADYIDNYIDEVVEQSKSYMKHAGRTELDVSDVKLALNETRKEEAKSRPAWNSLIKLAKEHNKSNLPPAKEKCGIPIPSSALNSINYRMKGSNTEKQITLSYPLPNYPTLNEIVANTARNPAAMNAIIRKLAGSSAMNLNPQHVIFKQQIPIRKTSETSEDLAFKKRKTL